MKKRFITLFLMVLTLSLFTFSVNAEAHTYFVDNAGLVPYNDEIKLEDKLRDLSEKHNMDILILTVDSIGSDSPSEYADMYLDTLGYSKGKDAVLLLISMEDRDWYILGNEYGKEVFDSDAREYASERFITNLSEGYYSAAFNKFADASDELITLHSEGEAYKAPFDLAKNIIISLVIGAIIAFIITYVMKNQLKSVKFNYAASDYVKRDSMKVTKSYDFYLYSTMTRTPKPKSNSSSIGGSRGGGGGKF